MLLVEYCSVRCSEGRICPFVELSIATPDVRVDAFDELWRELTTIVRDSSSYPWLTLGA